jgi:hypothetical protein
MKIVEICKQPKDVVWNDDKTFLCIFDNNGNQIEDYDFYSGLRLMLDGNYIKIFIHDEDLVSGKWKFFGTKSFQKDGKTVEEKVFFSGEKIEKNIKRKYENKNPWGITRGVKDQYVSAQEREKRMGVCRKCPMFVNFDGTCSVDGSLSILETKKRYSYCPEEKWGNKKKSIEKMKSEYPSDIINYNVNVDPTDQKNFEDELEEYLRRI